MAGDEVDPAHMRLLVVSPLAGGIGQDWLGRRWHEVSVAVTPAEALKAVSSVRPRFDVVVVDLMWNGFDDEWRFDGLDVLAAMEASNNGEWVVFAAQGHGFERDYIDEVHQRLQSERTRGQIRGLVLKPNLAGVLDGILTVAAGGLYVDPSLERHLRPAEQTVHHWFETSVRLPRFAGALAAGHPVEYTRLAELLHTSPGYLQKSPALFTEMMVQRGDIAPTDHVNLATTARWCGEHAHYIVSWCRRHGPSVPELRELAEVFPRREAP